MPAGVVFRYHKQYNLTMNARGEGGFTLIETILGLTVMAIMVLAVTNLFVSNLQTVTLSKARNIGLGLANEQIEYLRDLPYQNASTLNGAIYPPGTIPDTQTLVRGGYTFTVKTEISYIDDPADGNATGTAPNHITDLNPADYKRAQVSVYLKSNNALVDQLTTDIAAKAAETASNTGVIQVRVVDNSNNPVQDANITIFNATPNPDVNITTNTDSQGYATIPNLPPDSNHGYQLTITGPGDTYGSAANQYSSLQTIPDPAGTQTAVWQNLNVVVQNVQSVVYKVDRLGAINLHAVDPSGAPLASKVITVSSSSLIKTTPNVSKYSQSTTTDASGNISLTKMDPDSYSITPPSGYYLVSTQPAYTIDLAPNGTVSATLVLSTSSSVPRITSLSPTSQQTGTTSMSFTILGTNLTSGSTVKLRQSGQTDITATGVTSLLSNTKLTGNLNLSTAATGSWDIVVTNASGATTQVGGVTVAP
jgi:type II secretory pathway pseudopilin PulG